MVNFNLSDYINKGLTVQTFKLDNKEELFVTVKILVSGAEEGHLGLS